MVAIFTGAGFGFGRGSGSVLGGAGILGSSSQGRGGEGVFLNAASGNLLISKQDEFVAGADPDASIARTYNSLTSLTDDNNDKWRQSTDRRLSGFPATYGAAGSTIERIAGDGSEITYVWNANWRGQQGVQGSGAYVAIDGGDAYDTLYKSGTDWIWTDGDTNGQEVYYNDTATFGRAGLIRYYDDRTGQRINFNYQANSARLDNVTTTD